MCRFSATEWRQAIAHGETVGEPVKKNSQPRPGRQKISGGEFFRPVRGWITWGRGNPRFHRGLLSAAPTALGTGTRHDGKNERDDDGSKLGNCQFADVVDITFANWSQMRSFHGGNCDGSASHSDEFHFKGFTIFVDMDNRAHITRLPIFIRQVTRQHHAIMFFDLHLATEG